MIGALPAIGISANAPRVVRGVKVQHPCGDPNLPPEADAEVMMGIVRAALRAVQTKVETPTLFEASDAPSQEAVHAS